MPRCSIKVFFDLSLSCSSVVMLFQMAIMNYPSLMRHCRGVDGLHISIGLQEKRHAFQFQRCQIAHPWPVIEDAAVVEHDLAFVQRLLKPGERDRRMAADQPAAADTLPGDEVGTRPEHGFGVSQGIWNVEIESGMDDDEAVQLDVERKSPQKSAVAVRNVAGTVSLETCQGSQAAVGLPEFQIIMILASLQAHLFVVAANAVDRQAALPELEDEVQHPLAVRAPVDQVAQQQDAVTGQRTELFIDQPPQGGGTAVDVTDDERSRRHGHPTGHRVVGMPDFTAFDHVGPFVKL